MFVSIRQPGGGNVTVVISPEEIFPGGEIDEGCVLGVVRSIPLGYNSAFWNTYALQDMKAGVYRFSGIFRQGGVAFQIGGS